MEDEGRSWPRKFKLAPKVYSKFGRDDEKDCVKNILYIGGDYILYTPHRNDHIYLIGTSQFHEK